VSGLSLVTSGPLPPNPPELFGKASFLELLSKARKEYDWVVIDTPPVASVTDSVICAGLADMALLVVQYGGARRQVVVSAIRQLARSGVRIVGVLFNKVDMERDHYYYYSHYSYYRYGYHAAGEGQGGTGTAAAGKGAATAPGSVSV
jgi:capsular exopolysaccharide synthesis family protein